MPSPKAAAVGPDACAPLDQVSANMPGHCVPLLLFVLHMTAACVTDYASDLYHMPCLLGAANCDLR